MNFFFLNNFFFFADVTADSPNGNKTPLARVVSTLFIYGKPAVINCLRKLRNPSS